MKNKVDVSTSNLAGIKAKHNRPNTSMDSGQTEEMGNFFATEPRKQKLKSFKKRAPWWYSSVFINFTSDIAVVKGIRVTYNRLFCLEIFLNYSPCIFRDRVSAANHWELTWYTVLVNFSTFLTKIYLVLFLGLRAIQLSLSAASCKFISHFLLVHTL